MCATALAHALAAGTASAISDRMDKPHAGEHYDVLVLGAGFGGLAAATLLAKAGRRVAVLEARDRAGGPRFGFSSAGVGVYDRQEAERNYFDKNIRRVWQSRSTGLLLRRNLPARARGIQRVIDIFM